MNDRAICPDFELSELVSLDKELFVHTGDKDLDKLKSLTLTFSVIFNDFKTFMWINSQLEVGKPAQFDVSPYCGQWNGMKWHFVKLCSTLSFELSRVMGKNYYR